MAGLTRLNIKKGDTKIKTTEQIGYFFELGKTLSQIFSATG